VRGCLLKSEAAEELIRALESLRYHHTFRSRGITELYEKITATIGEIEELTAASSKSYASSVKENPTKRWPCN
jgi:hypothetical protein